MTTKPVIPEMPAWAVGNDLWERAIAFAAHAHRDQKRKYTHEPYIYHPLEVAGILLQVAGRQYFHGQELADHPEILAAAVLHDVVEDCGVTFTELEREFGTEVSDLVFWLSDCVEHTRGNRATRKRLEALRIGAAPLFAKIIKLADLVSNTSSIVEHDRGFAFKTYLPEKAFILERLHYAGSGIPTLEKCFPEIFHELYTRCKENVTAA